MSSERKHAFENARQFHNSLTEEQRVQHLEVYYRMIREKRKANPLLMHKGISDEETIREIINVDIPRIKQEAIEEAIRNGRPDIANDLRRRRLGVDTLNEII